MLKMVGYWKDKYDDAKWYHPRNFVQPCWERERLPLIKKYLKTGCRIRENLGFSYCRFKDGPPPEEMGNADLTDGEWIWPEGLWVYVERFSVKLPMDFVKSMERYRFEMPDGLDFDSLAGEEIDSRFWEEWCRNNRNSFWKKLLRRR